MRRPALIARGRIIGLFAVVAVATSASSVGCSLSQRLPATIRAVQSGPVDFAFDPDPLRLPPRAQISLTFDNTTDAPHTLILLAPIDVQTQTAVRAGEDSRLEFSTPDEGTYPFVCNVHEGMAGTLVVE